MKNLRVCFFTHAPQGQNISENQVGKLVDKIAPEALGLTSL